MRTALLSSGSKLTRSRELVIQVLEESKEHIDAEAIYERLKHQIGIATIYRTLELLVSLNVIECLCFEGTKYYRAKHEVKHVHFICEKCHKIYEYDDAVLEKTLIEQEKYIVDQHGHEVLRACTIFRGICKECKVLN